MTIYVLLIKLTLAAAKSGMLSAEDSRNAIDLIIKLKDINAFGTQASVNTGTHEFRWDGKVRHTLVCQDCKKDIDHHE